MVTNEGRPVLRCLGWVRDVVIDHNRWIQLKILDRDEKERLSHVYNPCAGEHCALGPFPRDEAPGTWCPAIIALDRPGLEDVEPCGESVIRFETIAELDAYVDERRDAFVKDREKNKPSFDLAHLETMLSGAGIAYAYETGRTEIVVLLGKSQNRSVRVGFEFNKRTSALERIVTY
jgi:hypothetical protein